MTATTALERHRAEVVARITALDAELESLRLARAEDNADDEHDPEGSTLSSDWSRLAGLRADALRELLQADEARARLADGSYGLCVTCGRKIPDARLAVRPAALQCAQCAAAR